MINRERIRPFLPSGLLSLFRLSRATILRQRFRGNKFFCNVCTARLKAWVYAGPVSHRNYVCPVCHSYGRHRMMVLVLDREFSEYNFLAGKKLLHFAPELGLSSWIRSRYPKILYKTADLSPLGGVDLRLNLEEISLPSQSVDFVILSHVLEHVDNDRKALQELNRILHPGGKLFIQVPLSGSFNTIEGKVDSPEERLLRYGKTDHVRLYGSDLSKRLLDAGFNVVVYEAQSRTLRDLFFHFALDLPEDSSMLYRNESTTFVCGKA